MKKEITVKSKSLSINLERKVVQDDKGYVVFSFSNLIKLGRRMRC